MRIAFAAIQSAYLSVWRTKSLQLSSDLGLLFLCGYWLSSKSFLYFPLHHFEDGMYCLMFHPLLRRSLCSLDLICLCFDNFTSSSAGNHLNF
jgi:hypothetical protein